MNKLYDNPEDEARLDPEGFFPEELYSPGTASYVIELIQKHKNRILEALPKMRKGENLDDALAGARALVKRVLECEYDIYDGSDNSIEWLRRSEILKENKDGKLEIDKAVEFQWVLLQCLIATEGLPGEYQWAVLMKVFAGMQFRFPGQKQQARAGIRAQIDRVKRRSKSTVKELAYNKEDTGHLQYKANKNKSKSINLGGYTTEELEEKFGLPARDIQRLRKEEEIWQVEQKKDKKKNLLVLTWIIAKQTQKVMKFIKIFKNRHGFEIVRRLKEAKDKLS